MRRPLVKIIVPCYRYADWLGGCVWSALDQPGVEARVLIIDDASPDHTPDVARALMAEDPRVEYMRHSTNQGLIGTINDGLRWADDSDYTVVLSADDLLVRGSLERATTVMEASPNVGLVYGRAVEAQVGRPLPSTGGRWRGTQVWPGHEWVRVRCRSAHNCISSPEVVVRTLTHRIAGRYDPDCVHTSDLNMWLRLAAVSDVAYVRGVPQAIYRIHSDSMLRSDRNPLLDLQERRKAFESLWRSSGALLKDSEHMRSMVGRALARQALWAASRAIDRGLTEGPEALPVDGLVAFAFDVFPDAGQLREWQGFRVRRRLGSGRSMWFFPFVVTGAAHRASWHVRRIRGMATGI